MSACDQEALLGGKVSFSDIIYHTLVIYLIYFMQHGKYTGGQFEDGAVLSKVHIAMFGKFFFHYSIILISKTKLHHVQVLRGREHGTCEAG